MVIVADNAAAGLTATVMAETEAAEADIVVTTIEMPGGANAVEAVSVAVAVNAVEMTVVNVHAVLAAKNQNLVINN